MADDLAAITRQLHDLAGIGFDALYLHHVGKEQLPFIEAFGEHVLPELRS